jgi:hypothetical protein
MNLVVIILLSVSALTALAAWPNIWPNRIRVTFAAISTALLGVAAVFVTSELLDGWSSEATVVALSGLLAVVGGGPLTLSVFTLVDRERAAEAPGEAAGPGPTSVTAAGSVLRGGAWIGALERAAVFATIAAGWPEGVAVVLALKGLARYPELRADTGAGRHAVAERFIIGTFVSLLWAVGCALVALAA